MATDNTADVALPVATASWSGTVDTPAAAPLVDFSIYNASGKHATAGGLWVGVKCGNVTPTSRPAPWVTTPSDYTADNGFTYEFAVTAGGAAWIKVTYNTSGTTDIASALSMGNGTTVPVDDPGASGGSGNGYLPCGTWDVASGALTIVTGEVGIGSQTVQLCGGEYTWNRA